MSLIVPAEESGGSGSGVFVPPPIPAVPPLEPPASLTEYSYTSQYAMDLIGVVINVNAVPTDIDGSMSVAMYPLPPPGTAEANIGTGGYSGYATTPVNPPPAIFSRSATRSAIGVYEVNFAASETSIPGYYRIDWTFVLHTVPQVISTYIQIGPAAPAYDTLPATMKQIVEDVFLKFQDNFDSPFGGLNLQMWFSNKFGRGRIAQLLRQSVQHLNNLAQPSGTYTVDGVGGQMFDLVHWSGILNTRLTIEVIRHLIRAYTEDPEIVGNVQARVSRRDYMQRWQVSLNIEEEDFRSEVEVWKLSLMFQGQPRVLLSGGAFGTYAPTRLAGSAAARPRYWARFYVWVLLVGIGLGGALGIRGSTSPRLRPSDVAVIEVSYPTHHFADALTANSVFRSQSPLGKPSVAV